jgi:hypothetical protein
VRKGNRLDWLAPTDDTDVVVDVVVTEPKEAGVTLGLQVRVAVVVTSAVLRVRKLADRGTLERPWGSRRVDYW